MKGTEDADRVLTAVGRPSRNQLIGTGKMEGELETINSSKN